MEIIYSIIKMLLLNYVPDPVLFRLKRIHYARKIRRYSLEREPDAKVVRHLVGPGDYVVDIGANVGLYTKVLSGIVGRDGLVFSIEPIRETFGILVANLRALHLDNVVPLNNAVSDANGLVTMTIPEYLKNAENHYRACITDDGGAGGRRVGVQAYTVDALFFRNLGRFSFVKCDVEGHELSCIRGAGRFLAESGASWLIEVSGDPDAPGTNASRLFAELSRQGYRPWWFDGRVLRPRERGDRSLNYFFLKEGHIRVLGLRSPGLLASGSGEEAPGTQEGDPT